ncbi:MAG TPA: vitamin K epoxide reductase family protein [Pyrinomonadaceae bacterium]|nr:vitamin K epoxide reductase family protein [Pyrinomonadaceae bacterium]
MMDNESVTSPGSIVKLPLAAAVVALVGLADSVYLTVKHLTEEPVPCSIVEGCETVLNSAYAAYEGIPLAAFGAVAYFIAFSLALLSAFGNRTTWNLFGVQVVLMSLFTAWLLYLQAYIIGAFCQFCLLSAATTFTMMIIFAISRIGRFK